MCVNESRAHEARYVAFAPVEANLLYGASADDDIAFPELEVVAINDRAGYGQFPGHDKTKMPLEGKIIFPTRLLIWGFRKRAVRFILGKA
jgi:hypothetical protein